MADTLLPSSPGPLKSVRVDALVVLKIIKHSSQAFPSIITGQLLGLEVDGCLQVTHSFPFPSADPPPTTDHLDSAASSSAAIAAPRLKTNAWYQAEMMKCLREINVDSNIVGWYQSANLGSFITKDLVENQYFYQSANQLNEKTVALVYDVARSSQGSLSLRAFRLTQALMAAMKEGKFTNESLLKHDLSYKNMIQELPVTIHNSHLLTSLLHQLSSPPTSLPPFAAGSANSIPPPLFTNYDSLDLSIDPFLERNCDLLLDGIETHYNEQNNFQYYQRSLAREQAKISAWQAKRKAENQARAAAKQPLLPDDEWTRLFKLPQEPSRLEGLLNSRQIEQYSRQIDGFAATASAKLFAVNGGLLKTD